MNKNLIRALATILAENRGIEVPKRLDRLEEKYITYIGLASLGLDPTLYKLNYNTLLCIEYTGNTNPIDVELICRSTDFMVKLRECEIKYMLLGMPYNTIQSSELDNELKLSYHLNSREFLKVFYGHSEPARRGNNAQLIKDLLTPSGTYQAVLDCIPLNFKGSKYDGYTFLLRNISYKFLLNDSLMHTDMWALLKCIDNNIDINKLKLYNYDSVNLYVKERSNNRNLAELLKDEYKKSQSIESYTVLIEHEECIDKMAKYFKMGYDASTLNVLVSLLSKGVKLDSLIEEGYTYKALINLNKIRTEHPHLAVSHKVLESLTIETVCSMCEELKKNKELTYLFRDLYDERIIYLCMARRLKYTDIRELLFTFKNINGIMHQLYPSYKSFEFITSDIKYDINNIVYIALGFTPSHCYNPSGQYYTMNLIDTVRNMTKEKLDLRGSNIVIKEVEDCKTLGYDLYKFLDEGLAMNDIRYLAELLLKGNPQQA